jgi:hypothetical protein
VGRTTFAMDNYLVAGLKQHRYFRGNRLITMVSLSYIAYFLSVILLLFLY